MRLTFSTIKKTATVFVCSLAVFLLTAYFYLELNLPREQQEAGKSESSVPYQKSTNENTCILVRLPDSSAVLLYLDFKAGKVSTALMEKYTAGDEAKIGYKADFYIAPDYYDLASFLDRLGGIEPDLGEGDYRYTGVQIIDMSKNGKISPQAYREILKSTFLKIAQRGLLLDDFIYIIENTETNLTVPDCYYWPEYTAELFSRAVFIN